MKKIEIDSKINNIHTNIETDHLNTVKVSSSKFFFGIKSSRANWFLFGGVSLLIIYSLLIVLIRFLFGLCVNYINNNNLTELNFFCLIIAIMGPVSFLFCILSGYFFKMHSNALCTHYKNNYYQLVIKQDYSWFNCQDLNKLSESMKFDTEKIAQGVFLFFFISIIIKFSIIFIPF